MNAMRDIFIVFQRLGRRRRGRESTTDPTRAAMTKAKRVHTSNDAGALAMSPNVRAMRGERRDARDARRRRRVEGQMMKMTARD
jgi:hypothetical protein